MKRKWWNEKVAYQIYPKSFLDSNGDGIGDLRGIINKLDYLKELGVDILWLSPIYCSPLADQGYDISDYYNIDPRFGSMEDMEELIAETKKRNMYVLMDLVVNHCSDEHAWFQQACENPKGKYGKYFYLALSKEGRHPCNWRSYFGGNVWEPLPGNDDLQYLHVFHKKQPDLNWENPELRKDIYEMINWWLDKGLAGFRIDAIINIKKKLPFRDYAPDRADGLSSIDNMLKEAEGIGAFLGEMRDETFKKYDAFTVGEVFHEKEDEIVDFIGENGYFSSMFDFAGTVCGKSDEGWYASELRITPEEYKKCCFMSQKRVGEKGFLSNIIENHDEPRGVSHYLSEEACNEKGKKLLALAYFMLRGLPFIYQGQELGMENKKFHSIDEVDDISGLNEYKVAIEAGKSPEEALQLAGYFCRDNARTPFQWDSSKNAGFTTGTPWLPLNDNYKRVNAQDELADKDSLFYFYKKMIALRKDPTYKECIVYGTLKPVWEDKYELMAYYRETAFQTLLVIANFSKDKQSIPMKKGYKKVLINNYDGMIIDIDAIVMQPYQGVMLEL